MQGERAEFAAQRTQPPLGQATRLYTQHRAAAARPYVAQGAAHGVQEGGDAVQRSGEAERGVETEIIETVSRLGLALPRIRTEQQGLAVGDREQHQDHALAELPARVNRHRRLPAGEIAHVRRRGQQGEVIPAARNACRVRSNSSLIMVSRSR